MSGFGFGSRNSVVIEVRSCAELVHEIDTVAVDSCHGVVDVDCKSGEQDPAC